jgi:hypothetical protein
LCSWRGGEAPKREDIIMIPIVGFWSLGSKHAYKREREREREMLLFIPFPKK